MRFDAATDCLYEGEDGGPPRTNPGSAARTYNYTIVNDYFRKRDGRAKVFDEQTSTFRHLAISSHVLSPSKQSVKSETLLISLTTKNFFGHRSVGTKLAANLDILNLVLTEDGKRETFTCVASLGPDLESVIGSNPLWPAEGARNVLQGRERGARAWCLGPMG
jgi:hypothetical protein